MKISKPTRVVGERVQLQSDLMRCPCLRTYVIMQLSDGDGVLVLDKSGFIKGENSLP